MDSSTGLVKRSFSSNYTKLCAFGLLSNGDLVTGYSEDRTLIVWDLKTNGEPLKRILQTREKFQYFTILYNDIAIFANYWVIIYDSETGLVKQRLMGHTANIQQIIVLPNRSLMTSAAERTIKIWQSPVKNMTFPLSLTSSVVLKNGNIATGLVDGTIYIWDSDTLRTIRVLRGHSSSICLRNCLFELKNGDLLSASYDYTLKVWNPNEGLNKFTVKEHNYWIRQIVLLASGNIMTISDTEIITWFKENELT